MTSYLLNSTLLNEHLWTQVLKHLNVHIYLVTISYRYYNPVRVNTQKTAKDVFRRLLGIYTDPYNQLISRTDLSPIPVRSAAKSYRTSWWQLVHMPIVAYLLHLVEGKILT